MTSVARHAVPITNTRLLRSTSMWWPVSLVGLALATFSLVALSGPGRIDIVDGQTRYEVARSLVDHGDHVIRDPHVWFAVFPGRDGHLYTTYRFPQTAAGVAAIVAADLTGPVSERRRHFFFSLIGAAACAIMVIAYATWFRHVGYAPRSALLWAGAGIVCTPSWFYGTSSFDDILGATAVVSAIVLASVGRQRLPLRAAAAAGLIMGIAFNCKEPLGIFILPVLAAIYDPSLHLRRQWARYLLVLMGLAAGITGYLAYDLYKFPPGTMAANAEYLEQYIRPWPGNMTVALAALILSPGASVLLYAPALPLGLRGLACWRSRDSWLTWCTAAAIAVFVAFIASVSFFKGDPAWGPRYLVPMFAVLWLFTPTGVRSLPRLAAPTLLALAAAIQLLSITVDPHRLYIEHGMPSAFGAKWPILHFHPALSHVLNRPREIAEILKTGDGSAPHFSPSPEATFAFPVIDEVERGAAALDKYHVLNSFRPWWIAQRYLDGELRPVDIRKTLLVLITLLLFGMYALRTGAARVLAQDIDRGQHIEPSGAARPRAG